MDFDFSDDQLSLRDAVAKWVEKGFDFSRRHAIAKAGGHTRAVYNELAELGLTGLAVPEAHGGLGFGAVEAMVVMEELGRGLVNAPYAAGALVTPVLLAAAPAAVQAAWLPKVASAEALVVLAHQERSARYALNHVSTTATQAAGGWVLNGQKGVVPAADEADAFIVPASARVLVVEGNYLLLANAPWWQVRPLLDLAVFIDVPREAVKARLLKRHAEHGLFSEARNREHVERVDLANYDLVKRSRGRADLAIDLVTEG